MRPSLNFPGRAEEALEHYRAAFGGEVEIVRFAGTPAAAHVPAAWGEKVLYGTLRSPDGRIDVMDAPPGHESPAGGNVAVAVDVADEARAAGIFAKLADGGEVLMPFEETFFARSFGMATDKFGIRWMVTCEVRDLAEIRG